MEARSRGASIRELSHRATLQDHSGNDKTQFHSTIFISSAYCTDREHRFQTIVSVGKKEAFGSRHSFSSVHDELLDGVYWVSDDRMSQARAAGDSHGLRSLLVDSL